MYPIQDRRDASKTRWLESEYVSKQRYLKRIERDSVVSVNKAKEREGFNNPIPKRFSFKRLCALRKMK